MTGLSFLKPFCERALKLSNRFVDLAIRLGDAYNPQRKASRREYAVSLLIAGSLFMLMYVLAMAAADWEEQIPDSVIMWLGEYPIPLITNALLFYTMAATARRLHDMGKSGAAALLLCLPEPWFIVIPIALLWPGRKSLPDETRGFTPSGAIRSGV